MGETTRISMAERLRTDYGWTVRQREVLNLIAQGKTNLEIADALGLSRDGAKYHVGEILSKLGADSREEAAEYWRRHNGLAPRFARVFRGIAAASVLKWSVTMLGVGGLALAVALWALGMNDDPSDGNQGTEPTSFPIVNAQPTQEWQYQGNDQYARVAASSKVVLAIGGRTDVTGQGNGGTVTLLERDTGRERWTLDVDCAPLYPAVDSERAYFPCTDGTVRAHDLDTGNQVWRAGGGAPVFLTADGERVYAVDGDPEAYDLYSVNPPAGTGVNSRVRAYDAATGDVTWDLPTDGYTSFIVLDGSTLYASTSAQNATGELLAITAATGNVLWRVPLSSASSRPYVDRQGIYAATTNGELARFDPATGKRVWTTQVPGGGVFESPVALGDVVIAGSNANSVFRLSVKDGAILARANYCDCPYSAARHGDRVVIAGTNSVFMLEPVSLGVAWEHPFLHQVDAAVAADGWIFASIDDTVIAFR